MITLKKVIAALTEHPGGHPSRHSDIQMRKAIMLLAEELDDLRREVKS